MWDRLRLREGNGWRWVAGVVVGVFCLWISLRGLEMNEVYASLSQVKPGWLALAVGSVAAVAVLKAGRWWLLFPARNRPASWRHTFPVLMTAQMLNVLIPLRLGELVRIGLMAQEGLAPGITLSTIVVEKSLDLLTVGLLVLAVPVSVVPDWLPSSIGLNMGFTGVLLLVMLLCIWRGRAGLQALAVQVLSFRGWLPVAWRERLLRLLSQIFDGLGALAGYRAALWVLGLTILIWLASILTMVAMLAAFDLVLTWHVALILALALHLSNLAPTPPALVGVVAGVTVVTLGWFGVPQTLAAALGLVLNIVLVGPLVLLGGWSAWLRFMNLTQGAPRERWVWSLGLRKKH